MPSDPRAVISISGSASASPKIIVPPTVELTGRRRLGDANPPAANRDDRLHFKRLPMPLKQLGH